MHVPEGWTHTLIEEYIDLLSGYPSRSENYSDDPDDILLLRGDNIEPGALRWRDAKRCSKDELPDLKKYELQVGDFVIAMDRTWISSGLKVAEVKASDIPCLLVQRVSRIRAQKTFSQSLLKQVFSTHRFEQYVKGVQTETAVPHISAAQIKEFPVLVPPLPEQQKIAQILSTWDKAIEKVEALIAAKQKRKKALMQHLLTGKNRFAGFDEPWIEVSMGEVFKRITRKNTEENTNVVTISAQKGLIKQDEFFNKSIASEILDNYFLLKKGEFAYNKSYSNGYPMGAVKRLNNYDKAVVTTLYICFAIKDKGISCSNFFEQYFESGRLVHGLMKVANEGGRAHGLLNVTPKDFFGLKLFIPQLTEQQKIASVLTAADTEIETHQKQLAALKQQKKGLMQQLLTGKKRVKLDGNTPCSHAPAWEYRPAFDGEVCIPTQERGNEVDSHV